MYKRANSVRIPTKSDTFSDTWGGSTRYKSGTIKRLRAEAPDLPAAAIPITRNSTRIIDLDKPLPALPTEDPAVAGARAAVRNINEEQSPQPRSHSSVKQSSGVWKRRLAIFRRSSTKGVNKPLPPAPVTELTVVPSLSQAIENAPPRKPTYVDAGTQTSSRLLPMRPADPAPPAAARRPSGTISRRPTFSRKASQMSPLAEETPTSSPKGFWIKVAPSDYFSLPFRSDRAMSSDKPRSRAGNSERRSSEESTKSGSSIATYESRYSAPEQREPTSSMGRPSLARAANTDSVIEVSSSSSSGTITRPGLTALPPKRPSTMEPLHGGRPMPIPFTRLPSFSANRYRRGDSSRGSISPLRHSLKLPDSPPESLSNDARPPSPGSFRQPVVTPTEPEGQVFAFIPDHLKGSPLCPRHPKHNSGGTGFCPMHGRNRSAESDASSEMDRGRKSSRQLSEKTSTDGSIDEAFRSITFSLPKHDANSRDCPANAGKQGICPYHGRSIVYGAGQSRDYSGESVTRVRLRGY